MNTSKTKILVTGGAGFVGSHLVDSLLKDGFYVISVDDYSSGKSSNLENARTFSHFEEIRLDISLFDELEKVFKKGIDIVFHQAVSKMTICLDNPLRDLDVNAGGTLRLLELSKKYNIKKFVHASTGSVYGEAQYYPTDELHLTNPSSYYGVSKLAAERYANVFSKLWGLDVTILRYYHVYGPRQESSDVGGVVSIFARRALEGKPIIIYGDGTQIRSFTYVQDIVDINRLALTNKSMTNQVFNCASGISVSIRDLANQVCNELHCSDHEIIYEDWKPGDIKHFDVANEKLKSIGFDWKVPFDEGLSNTLSWSKNWIQENN
jgi:UDP-glucose 4-epimerase